MTFTAGVSSTQVLFANCGLNTTNLERADTDDEFFAREE